MKSKSQIMKKPIQLLLLLMCSLFGNAFGQNPHSDVAVIVNTNSPVSVSLGNFYASHRGMSSNRIIQVATTTARDIDSLGFRDLQAQIEAALIAGNLLDTVQYLVTTKDMPQRVSVRNACDSVDTQPASSTLLRCTCLESELSLILSPMDSMILNIGTVANPYFNANQPFSRNAFGIFVVTRMDGNTQADVQALIQRTGAWQPYSPQGAQAVFDYYGASNTVGDFFRDQIFPQYSSACATLGLTANVDTVNSFLLQNQQGVILYDAFHGGAATALNFSYEPGAVAHLSNYTALYPGAGQQYSGAFSVLSNGADAVLGHTSPYYFSTGFYLDKFIPRYLDTTIANARNLGESAFASQTTLSSMNLAIGDPKLKLTSGITAIEPGNSPGGEISYSLYPNPASGNITHIQGLGQTFQPISLRIVDVLGRLMNEQLIGVDQNRHFSTDLDLEGFAPGTYFVSLRQGASQTAQRLVVLE
jgi:uncharacterized protein (TIGR03790 family)